MTSLKRRALARLAITEAGVEATYKAATSGHGHNVIVDRFILMGLCESHERLRAELQGAEVLLKEAEAKLAVYANLEADAARMAAELNRALREHPPFGKCDACGSPNLEAGNCSRVQCCNHD